MDEKPIIDEIVNRAVLTIAEYKDGRDGLYISLRYDDIDESSLFKVEDIPLSYLVMHKLFEQSVKPMLTSVEEEPEAHGTVQ